MPGIGIEVTAVEVRIPEEFDPDRPLRAYATVTLNRLIAIDNFVVRQVDNGRLVVGFPIKPLRPRCDRCGKRTGANLPRCGHCGEPLPRREVFHRPAVEPLSAAVGAAVQTAVLRASCA